MKWIKANERLPIVSKVFIRNIQSKSGGMLSTIELTKMDGKENVEWLDESKPHPMNKTQAAELFDKKADCKPGPTKDLWLMSRDTFIEVMGGVPTNENALYETRLVLYKLSKAFKDSNKNEQQESAMEEAAHIFNKYSNIKESLRTPAASIGDKGNNL